MKRFFILFTLMEIHLLSAFCGGLQQKELVNMQEIELDRIDIIEIRYRSDPIVVFDSNSDTFVLKEYMSDNNRDYYAKITNSGNKLVIEAGQRPKSIFNALFRCSIEVYIPVSNKSIAITTSSGSIETVGECIASSMTIGSSSGSISVNSVSAKEVKLKNSSGSINCQKANGNTRIETRSGSIVCTTINGDLFANSSSGRMVLDQVSGSLNASTTSGSIHSGAVGGDANIRTGSGSIVARSINGIIAADSSSGSVYCVATENTEDITITTSSGSVTLDIPRNFTFNFSSWSSSGSLKTPFSDKLYSRLSDRHSIQGIIGDDNASDNQVHKHIGIRTGSGSITVNWIN